MFRIFLTNLGKYNEGELVGEWVDLPCDDFDSVFESIGIGEEYEEYFITDYENDFGYRVGEYENLEELNDIAEEVDSLSEWRLEILEVLISDGNDFYEALQMIDDVIVYPNCLTMGEVAQQYAEETGLLDSIPESLQMYFDFDAYGRDMEINGEFIYSNGNYYEVIR